MSSQPIDIVLENQSLKNGPDLVLKDQALKKNQGLFSIIISQ